jgi:hypothetical protein
MAAHSYHKGALLLHIMRRLLENDMSASAWKGVGVIP